MVTDDRAAHRDAESPAQPWPFVILPDRRRWLEEILGRDAALPDGARWLDLTLDADGARARYALGDASCALRFVRTAAPTAGLRHFCVEGDATPALHAAVVARVAAQEARFGLAVPAAARRPIDHYLPAPLALRAGMRVLELGAGDAATSRAIAAWARDASAAVDVVALDLDPSRADGLRGSGVRFVCADAFRVPPALGRFDVILCLGCISQMVMRRPVTALDGLVAHWSSLLTASGQLIVQDIDRDADGDDGARGAALFEREKWPLIPPATLEGALRARGFRAVARHSALQCYAATRANAADYLGLQHCQHPQDVESPWGVARRTAPEEEGAYAFSYVTLQAHRGA